MNYKHGMSKNRFWNIFQGIKKRCNCQTSRRFRDWGGRGIKCEWLSFEEFKKDMHESYKIHCKKFGEKYTQIDRINNKGHYNVENCRWVTPSQNSRNRKSNVILEFNGEKHIVKEWAEILGINEKLIYGRISRGWDTHKTLTTPKLI